ncbi:MAG: family 43 glycosylhydrolase, partial [Kiritimatiellales bacterium]
MKQLAGMIFLSWMLLSTASANTIRLEFAGTESLWQEQSIGRVELSGTGVVENAGIENAANFLISGSTAVDFGLTFDAGIINPADGSEDTDQVISMNADGLGIVGGGSSGLGKGNNEGYTVSVDFGEAEAVDILQVSKVRLTNINESKTGRIFNLTDGQWLAFNGSGQVDGVLWLDVYSLGITITGPQVDIPLFSLCNDSDTTYRIDGVELVVVKKTPRREIFQETWEGVASNLVYSGGESGSLFSSVDGTDEDWTYSIDSEMDAAIHPVAAFGDSMAIEHLGGNSGSISFSSTLKKPITIRDGVPVTLKAHFAWNELGANAFRDNEWRLLNDTGAGGYVLRATGETDKDYVFRFVVDHLDVSTDVTVGTPGSQVVGHDYGVEVTFTPNGADTDVSWTITDNGALWDSGSGTVAGTALTGLSMREVNWYSRPNCRCAVDSLCVEEGLSGSRRAYCNPLDLRIGDPRIMRTENANADYLYYLSGTGRRRVVSDDAVNWEEKGVWMPTSDGGQTIDNTWGTEIHEKDGHFYVYFAAYVDGDTSKRQICVSEAGDPDATFSKLAWPIFSSSHKWIGPNVFTDTDGTSYLYATDDSKELNGGEA